MGTAGYADDGALELGLGFAIREEVGRAVTCPWVRARQDDAWGCYRRAASGPSAAMRVGSLMVVAARRTPWLTGGSTVRTVGTTPLWVPLLVAVLGMIGTGGGALAGALITSGGPTDGRPRPGPMSALGRGSCGPARTRCGTSSSGANSF